jgi:hypothetical protein
LSWLTKNPKRDTVSAVFFGRECGADKSAEDGEVLGEVRALLGALDRVVDRPERVARERGWQQ